MCGIFCVINLSFLVFLTAINYVFLNVNFSIVCLSFVAVGTFFFKIIRIIGEGRGKETEKKPNGKERN